jgi:hypothetical protein
VRADRAGPAPGGKRMATRVRGGPRRSESFNQDRTEGGPKGVRTGPSRSEPFDLNRMEGN